MYKGLRNGIGVTLSVCGLIAITATPVIAAAASVSSASSAPPPASVFSVTSSAASAFSATSTTQASQQPPATTKPAVPQTPAQPPAQPPAPFPEGAKVAYIFMQGIFSGSVEGKAATAKLQEWEKKKVAEIQEKNKQAQALQAKLQQSSTVLNDNARTQGERDLQKLQREIQAMQEDAQQEGQQLRQQLLDEFSKKVNPVIAAIGKERGLHMIFSVADDANVAWADPGLNLTAEVIKRVDTATAVKK